MTFAIFKPVKSDFMPKTHLAATVSKLEQHHSKLELCAFALKGDYAMYISLVPNIAVCMYIYIY